MLYDFAKRTIDILGSILGLFFLSPFLILVWVVIKLDSQGPSVYTPERVGKGGKLFKMYKFRSMMVYKIAGATVHADEYLKTKPALFEKYKAGGYKLSQDPRLTRLGPFLRQSSIDELPQLVNILKGEMSFVGPRAYLPEELAEQQKIYPKTAPLVKTLLRAKPGLTGFWQVSGRSQIPFDRRIEMDVEYIKKRSILYDFYLILKTIPVLISGKGAV